MTAPQLLKQLNRELQAEIFKADFHDPLTKARIGAKLDLIERGMKLLVEDEKTVETIDTGDSEHSIIEPVAQSEPENGEPF